MSSNYSFPVIGTVHSCFKEKFGVPRQPGLVVDARGEIELFPPYNDPDAISGLDSATHIWIIFVFHLNKRTEWKPKVRPPRLGGNQQMGVFATRSPVRPAPIGMSAVKLEGIERGRILVSGLDLVDKTPVLDIKPYVPYTDSLPFAENSFAGDEPEIIPVNFSARAQAECDSDKTGALERLIVQVLSQDPRPKYQKSTIRKNYGMLLYDKNIRWEIQADGSILVTEIHNN